MGIITLTDRISVRVSAKNDTQSNDYKKATGGAIGKTLGNEDISDELKTQLGNTTKPVITDEDGNAWISMADIIAAGKAMNGDGAFEEKTTYEGIGGYKLSNVYSGPLDVTELRYGSLYGTVHIPSGTLYSMYNDGGWCKFYIFSKEAFNPSYTNANGTITTHNSSPTSVSINGVSYSYFYSNVFSGNANNYEYVGFPASVFSEDRTNLDKKAAGILFGDSSTSGGSLIDWTKSDADIEEDIRDLHETWDVSEHEGSVTANGTYVLAGPIEFNPGD